MAQDSEKIKSIILDTNVIFSSLVKEEGYTQATLSILMAQKDIKLMIPLTVKEEIKRHMFEISRKSGLPMGIVSGLMNKILGNIEAVSDERMKSEIKQAMSLVREEKDAPFAGLALKFRPSIILTYNKRHFISDELERNGVKVFRPSELIKYFNMELRVRKKVKRKRGILKLLSRFFLLKKIGE